jgi:hypothetical protein
MQAWIRRICVLFIALGALALNFARLNAQTSKGTITGTVTDATGAGVPGATVTAREDLGNTALPPSCQASTK